MIEQELAEVYGTSSVTDCTYKHILLLFVLIIEKFHNFLCDKLISRLLSMLTYHIWLHIIINWIKRHIDLNVTSMTLSTRVGER